MEAVELHRANAEWGHELAAYFEAPLEVEGLEEYQQDPPSSIEIRDFRREARKYR